MLIIAVKIKRFREHTCKSSFSMDVGKVLYTVGRLVGLEIINYTHKVSYNWVNENG